MATQCDGPVVSFTANEDLEPFRCVMLGSGRTVEYCDANDIPIGVTQRAAIEGEQVPVRMFSIDGTLKIEAGEAFADLADLYTGDDGKVVDTDPGAGTIRFQALEAASGSGSVVECVRKLT